MEPELAQAEQALAAGRDDEALVLLWNALEPARLRGDPAAYEAIRRLARLSDHRDADLLLAELERLAGPAPDDAHEEEAEPQPSLAARAWRVVFPLVVLVLIALSAASALFGNGETPDRDDVQPRARNVAALPVGADGVYLVALGRFEAASLDELAAYYAARLHIPVGTLEAVSLPPETLDEEREQLVCEELLELLALRYPVVPGRRVVVIGLTDLDKLSRDRPEFGTFFARRAARTYGLVSAAHLDPGFLSRLFGDDPLEARVRKLVLRNIGVLWFGRPLVPDPESVLYDDLDGVGDIDRMREEL